MKRYSLLAVVLLAIWLQPVRAQEVEPPDDDDNLNRWQFYQEVTLPDFKKAEYADFLLPVSVFDKARNDLGDLRLYDAGGQEVPYALRVREPKSADDPLEANVFNRGRGPDGSTELSLELKEAARHNRVEIAVPGKNFRRRATLDGSDDGENWLHLAEGNLLRFEALEDRHTELNYPISSFSTCGCGCFRTRKSMTSRLKSAR